MQKLSLIAFLLTATILAGLCSAETEQLSDPAQNTTDPIAVIIARLAGLERARKNLQAMSGGVSPKDIEAIFSLTAAPSAATDSAFIGLAADVANRIKYTGWEIKSTEPDNIHSTPQIYMVYSDPVGKRTFRVPVTSITGGFRFAAKPYVVKDMDNNE